MWTSVYPDDYVFNKKSNVEINSKEYAEALTATPSPFESRAASPIPKKRQFDPEQFGDFKLDFSERNNAFDWVKFGIWVNYVLIFREIIFPESLLNKLELLQPGSWCVTKYHHLGTEKNNLLNCLWRAKKNSSLDNGSNLQESTWIFSFLFAFLIFIIIFRYMWDKDIKELHKPIEPFLNTIPCGKKIFVS